MAVPAKRAANAYAQFVKANVGRMPGATQKEKMRAVAAEWKKKKGSSGQSGGGCPPKDLPPPPSPPPEEPAAAPAKKRKLTSAPLPPAPPAADDSGEGLDPKPAPETEAPPAAPAKKPRKPRKKREIVEEADPLEDGDGMDKPTAFKGGQMTGGGRRALNRLGAGNLGGFGNLYGHIGYGMKLPADPLGNQEGSELMGKVLGGAMSWRLHRQSGRGFDWSSLLPILDFGMPHRGSL